MESSGNEEVDDRGSVEEGPKGDMGTVSLWLIVMMKLRTIVPQHQS